MRPRKVILLYGLEEPIASRARIVLDARGYRVRTAADMHDLLRLLQAAGQRTRATDRLFAMWYWLPAGDEREALEAQSYALAPRVQVLCMSGRAGMAEVLDKLRTLERLSPHSNALYVRAKRVAAASERMEKSRWAV